jgi:hypothetical protein
MKTSLVSHIGFVGRALSAKQSYNIMSLGKNIVASSDRSAKHLVKLWAGSKSYDHNMRSDWAYTGISTQLFGNSPLRVTPRNGGSFQQPMVKRA